MKWAKRINQSVKEGQVNSRVVNVLASTRYKQISPWVNYSSQVIRSLHMEITVRFLYTELTRFKSEILTNRTT